MTQVWNQLSIVALGAAAVKVLTLEGANAESFFGLVERSPRRNDTERSHARGAWPWPFATHRSKAGSFPVSSARSTDRATPARDRRRWNQRAVNRERHGVSALPLAGS